VTSEQKYGPGGEYDRLLRLYGDLTRRPDSMAVAARRDADRLSDIAARLRQLSREFQ
jgi:hypothetical protein